MGSFFPYAKSSLFVNVNTVNSPTRHPFFAGAFSDPRLKVSFLLTWIFPEFVIVRNVLDFSCNLLLKFLPYKFGNLKVTPRREFPNALVNC